MAHLVELDTGVLALNPDPTALKIVSIAVLSGDSSIRIVQKGGAIL